MLASLSVHGQYVYTKIENAIISLNQIAPLNNCSLQLWVMNLLARMLKSLPRNHAHHCLQPCCHPSVCIEFYLLQNSPI